MDTIDGVIGDSELLAMAQNRTPDKNYVKFYKDKKRMNKLSDEAGRDIYEDRDFVLILTPGQNKTEVRREATDLDKKNYPSQWQQYCQNKEQMMIGTPLDMVPGIGPSRLAALKMVNIFTAEQMAELPEVRFHDVGMDARKLQQTCKAFIDKQNPEILALRAENQALATQLAELKAMVEALQSKPSISIVDSGTETAPI